MSDKLHGVAKAGATSVSLPVLLLSAADSTELTGKVAADVTASYWRQGGTRTAITPGDLGSVNAAYSSGGWKEVDATNQPGLYRLDVPDAALATGADWVVISVKVTTAFAYHERIALETLGSAEVGARIGVAGANLTAIGDTRVANLDATISSRMATFTLPTNFAALGINGSGHVSRVTLADTLTTYTGNTPQTGDSFARIGAAGASLTALGDARLVNLDATITSRAAATDLALVGGYLDTEIAAMKLVMDHLATAIELDGSVYRFTTNALEQAPTGGGGGSVTVAGYAAGQDPATLLDGRFDSVDAALAAILDDTGTTGVVVAAGSKAGYALSASGVDAVAIESGVNARQALSVILSASAGVLSGADPDGGTIIIKGGNVATTRITTEYDTAGNRTSVTLSLPA